MLLGAAHDTIDYSISHDSCWRQETGIFCTSKIYSIFRKEKYEIVTDSCAGICLACSAFTCYSKYKERVDGDRNGGRVFMKDNVYDVPIQQSSQSSRR